MVQAFQQENLILLYCFLKIKTNFAKLRCRGIHFFCRFNFLITRNLCRSDLRIATSSIRTTENRKLNGSRILLKKLDTRSKTQYNYTILKISRKISCIKSAVTPILPFLGIFFSRREMTQKTSINPYNDWVYGRD